MCTTVSRKLYTTQMFVYHLSTWKEKVGREKKPLGFWNWRSGTTDAIPSQHAKTRTTKLNFSAQLNHIKIRQNYWFCNPTLFVLAVIHSCKITIN